MATACASPGIRVNKIPVEIVNAAMKVHSLLGLGRWKTRTKPVLAHELRKRGLRVETQVRKGRDTDVIET
jgi:PD-(D/E)XK nuclease superfamily